MNAPTHAEIAERNALMRQKRAQGWSVQKLGAVFRLSMFTVENILHRERNNPKAEQPVQSLQKAA